MESYQKNSQLMVFLKQKKINEGQRTAGMNRKQIARWLNKEEQRTGGMNRKLQDDQFKF